MTSRLQRAHSQAARFALVVVLSTAGVGWARMGGGEHYSGGSHRSSSSSSRSSSHSWSGGTSGFSRGTRPTSTSSAGAGLVLAVVLIVLSAVVLARLRERRQQYFAHVDQELQTPPASNTVSSWCSELASRDAQFRLPDFLERTRKTFLLAQDAWATGNLAAIRWALSDGTFQRLSTQLALRARQGVRDVQSDAEVLHQELVGVSKSSAFDSVHVRITARMRDAEAPLDASPSAQRELAKAAPLSTFSEVWTWTRRAGAATLLHHNGAGDRCPNCGAPFPGGATNACEHCQAVVNSGVHDWVLSEITQSMEYLTPTGRQGPVLAQLEALRATDVAVSSEAIEDRASLCFWRWIAAGTQLDQGSLHRVATADFSRGTREASPLTCFDVAVGAADLVWIETFDGREHAMVDVRWSFRHAPGASVTPMRNVLHLVRNVGAKSASAAGLATNRCGNCNAPETAAGAASCSFCGAALNSGEHEWVLERIDTWEAFAHWRSQRGVATNGPLPASARSSAERLRLLLMMVQVVMADGRASIRELKLLRECAKSWGLSWQDIERGLTQGAGSANEAFLGNSGLLSREDQQQFLLEAIRMANIDGRIEASERRIIEQLARRFSLEDALPSLFARGGV